MYNSSSKNLSERPKGTNKDIYLCKASKQRVACIANLFIGIGCINFASEKENNLLKESCKVHDVKGFHLVGQVRVLIAYHRNVAM